MNSHRHCQELLPWFANGSLNAADMTFCESHLRGCEACREDLDTITGQMQVLNREAREPLRLSPDRLLASLGARRVPRWPAALAAAFLLGVTALLTQGVSQRNAYQLLSTPAAGHFLQVAFVPSASEGDIRRFVLSSGGSLEGNPTAAGIYRLRYAAPIGPRKLEQLKQDPVVAWMNSEL